MSDFVRRSNALDQSFIEERGQGVIEENEVLVRGEWKRPTADEDDNEDSEDDNEDSEDDNEDSEEETGETVETVNDSSHICAYCGKQNVS